ncbi:DUF4325 domain-containing protein [Helicobacter sp. MIT 03-1614]|jgi:hypothetical protein|uniref:DUF4325 domain-containing protein n=2 Tax=Helicobacter TaxID=209 RepID=Q7VJH0_HELHP|nr:MULTISPECIES: STAS-like domain-containing protein [Helicobacter]AAP76870.1 hypothetical protein HH_0273 [Helicobacter hepaticus ATCC 51449]TLD87745.1 DUF4325 domain-containing protein [Helicobacter sp. MIT 03-1614]
MLNVAEIIGKNIGVTTEDGEKLHNKIKETYKEGQKIEVSFDKVMVISHFLNVAIGKLYFEFPETSWDSLDKDIVYRGLSEDDDSLLKKEVIETAKFQSKNPNKAEEIQRKVLRRK